MQCIVKSQPSSLHLLCIALLLTVLFSWGCRQKTTIIADNDAPYYGEVSTVLVENYVNRMYIDLLGREPLDVEIADDVAYLRSKDLAMEAREEILFRLQFDTLPRSGDSSYNYAYFNRLYELAKIRLLEGVGDAYIEGEIGILRFAITRDSLLGDSVRVDINRARKALLEGILLSGNEYRNGTIGFAEMHSRMILNDIYDEINMNSFNFINAVFNDLYFRFPSSAEFDAAYEMVDLNRSAIIFQSPGQNKSDFVGIAVGTNEFSEGLIRWAFLTLVAREPTTAEVVELMNDFVNTRDFPRVQREIMKTDEYANF